MGGIIRPPQGWFDRSGSNAAIKNDRTLIVMDFFGVEEQGSSPLSCHAQIWFYDHLGGPLSRAMTPRNNFSKQVRR